MKIGELNVGEFEARREYLRGKDFFLNSFQTPYSFLLSSLRCSKKFLLTGRKGAGKTSAQLFIQNQKESDGYLCSTLSFHEDLSREDYQQFARSQSSVISLKDLASAPDITSLYDFKLIWQRILLMQLSGLVPGNHPLKHFCNSSSGGTNSILDGIKKGLKVKASAPSFLGSEITFEYDHQPKEVSLSEFCDTGRRLLISAPDNIRAYLFVDELVISSLNTKGDEYKLRLALIRDLLIVIAQFNDLFASGNIDCHVIGSLRPEVRHRLNQMDAEISKVIDSNDVLVAWEAAEDDAKDHPLITLMLSKLGQNPEVGSIEAAAKLFPETVSFGNTETSTFQFLLNSSWYRPRDMVRYLQAFSKARPHSPSFSDDVIRAGLDEYARISAKEMLDELAVRFSEDFVGGLQKVVRRRYYDNFEHFRQGVLDKLPVEGSPNQTAQALFEVGLFYNLNSSGTRFFSAHRGEEEFVPDMQFGIHKGLWNFFNVRSF